VSAVVASGAVDGVRKRLRHLPSGLSASAVLLVLGVVTGALAGGAVAAAGAALGIGVVAASFSLSSVVIAWADSIDPWLVLPAGLMTYAAKFTALGLGVVTLAVNDWAGLSAFCFGLIAATLAWITAQAWWTWHAKILYVD